MSVYIVAWDPKGEWWDGAVVTEKERNLLEARGVVLLPVQPEMFKLSGVGGFHKRSWGAGWPTTSQTPRFVAPLTLYATTECRTIHWAARLVVEPSRDRNGSGFLRLAPDGGQANPLKASLSFVDGQVGEVRGAALGDKPDADGGWTVRGSATLGIPQDGHHGFGLYGHMDGVAVAWAAASVMR